MASYEESACNGCPECRECGRSNKRYIVYRCDQCGYTSQDENEFDKSIYGVDLCRICYMKG